MTGDEAGREDWPQALATVTQCVYDARAGRALAFGLTSKKHFRIAYNYWAQDQLHTGEFYSERPLEPGHLFPVRFNPELPHQNRSETGGAPERISLLAIGLLGSVLLSLAWLFFLHGCM